MHIVKPMLRTAVFIDGANHHIACAALGRHCDYQQLHAVLHATISVRHITFFLPASENSDTAKNAEKLLSFLAYNGYRVRTLPQYRGGRESQDGRINVPVEMALAMIDCVGHVDQIILFSGDADFVPVVEYLQRRNIRVVAVSTRAVERVPMSDQLRRAVDEFVELAEETEFIQEKKPKSA
jgi:uncharacterized LabA/DUF88 family protein